MSRNLVDSIDKLILESEDDYVSLQRVIKAANAATDADPSRSRMERTLDLLDRLLGRGFQIVRMTADGGCVPWPDQSRAAILGHIEREWLARGEDAVVFDFWFDLPDSLR